MKIYLNEQYKCVKVEDNTFVANSTSNFVRYYFVRNADGTVVDEITAQTEVYSNQEPSYVTLGFRRADGNTIQHLMATPKVENDEPFWEYIITDADGVLYKKGALEVSAQFINATLNSENKIISQKVMAVAINTAHILDNIGEEAEEYYSQYEQANNEAHAALQSQITTNFNNIGILQELTTDAKDDLVKAINEVDAHADANKSEIGDLSTLTTDEKTTIVGAINEVDEHADTAQQTADNATVLANTGISKAEQAQATANNAVATANEAKTTAQTAENNANNAVDTANAANATADEAKAIAQGSQRAIGFATLQAAITALNGYSNTQLKVGDNVYIVETGVPDLWVAAVEQNSVAYNYTTNDAFNDDLVENTLVQVGYYKFAYLESDGKPCTVAWQNMTVAASDWVASTEFEDFAYEAKIILSDFVNFSSIPQVVFGLTEATSGNYAPICKAGDKGVYIYSKVNTTITLPTVVTFAPNVHGASMQGGGYNNRGKWVASTTYAIDDLVYTDNGQYVCIEGITSTTSPEQDAQHWQATFVATGKTKNTLTISGQDNGTGVQKTFDGSQAVEIAFDENTMTAKEVNGVLKVGAKGTIPEALPQEASALKSGKLPTSGWIPMTENFAGETIFPKNNSGNVLEIPLYPSGYADYYTILNWFVFDNGEWHELTKVGSYNLCTYYGTYSFKTELVSAGPFINVGSSPCYYRIYPDGHVNIAVEARMTSEFVMPPFKNGSVGKAVQTFPISDTSITANSDVLMELTDDGGVKSYSMEAGKITVIRDTVPTQPIPYTYKVKQTNASGQFTLVNHYVPEVPETPTSLPVSYKKASGSLPTNGWTPTVENFTNARILDEATYYNKEVIIYQSGYEQYIRLTGWEVNIDGEWHKLTKVGNVTYAYNYYNIAPLDGGAIIRWEPSSVNAWYYIHADGHVSAKSNLKSDVQMPAFRNTEISEQTFAITDTFITANTSVKMYLTDAGGVKAQSKANGSITVIRDSVPTTAIPYEYEAEQTSDEGLFEVINAYVPAVPTKTSELTNDSGFITAADIGNALYPVGSIYMSVNNTNPSTFFGGTWEAWGAGKVPVGVDANDTDFATVEKTGGEKTHTLTESEIPAHRHTVEAIGTGTTQQELNAFSVDNQGAVDSYGTTSTAGGGQAHNNLQPYITCYMWKRTA